MEDVTWLIRAQQLRDEDWVFRFCPFDDDAVVQAVEPVTEVIDGEAERISSTMIRRLVDEGRVEEAGRCLGRDFALFGRIEPGEGKGRLLDFPTANIDPGEQVCPADGVYAGVAEIGGRRFMAAVSIGNKPTLGPAPRRYVEAFLLDARDDYYDKEMALSFRRRLREQRRFSGMEELKARIAKDVENVRRIVGQGI